MHKHKQEQLHGKRQALNVISVGQIILIVGFVLQIVGKFIGVHCNSIVGTAMVMCGIIAMLIACAVLAALLKKALDDYFGLDY